MTLDGLLIAYELKALPRAGWLRVGVEAPESVAAHSWGMALLTLSLLPPDLDLGKALAYAALHDLPEVIVGDITPADGVPREEKQRRENTAMTHLAGTLPRGEALSAQWRAYEAQDDPEARFVKQLDALDMALQALVYRRRGTSTAEFVTSAQDRVEHPVLRPLLDTIIARMQDSEAHENS